MYQGYIKKILVSLLFCFCIWGAWRYFFSEARVQERNLLKQSRHQKLKSYVKLASNQDSTNAKEAPFQEGKHYQKLSAKITTAPAIQALIAENPGKIQVIEFFNYGCFWCRKLHPELDTWHEKYKEKIVFRRYPVVFNKGWEVLAKAYYVVEQLEKTAVWDKEFFKAVHEDNIDLTKEALLKEFFAKQGVEEATFKGMYDSFAVARKLSYSNDLSNAYQIVASPAVIINTTSASYLITPSMAGGALEVLKVMDYVLSLSSEKS